MKASKIFGLAVMVLFIGTVLAFGINHILDKIVPHSLKEIPTSQSLTPSKIEPPKAIMDEQIKSEEKDIDTSLEDLVSKRDIKGISGEEVSESRKSVNEDIQMIEEELLSEETIIATTAPIPSSNITGPPVEPGKITKELPAFAPFGSYSGPSAATSTITVSRGSDTQGPTSIIENTEKTYQDISASVPIENSGGPPIDPQRTYKELPPFTPITNKTGPTPTE